MSRVLTTAITTSVMAMALTVTNVALADEEAAPAPAKVEAPKVEAPKVETPKAPTAPVVANAAPTTTAAPKAPAPAPTTPAAPTQQAAPTPTPTPAPTPTLTPAPTPTPAAQPAAVAPAPAPVPAPAPAAETKSELPLRPTKPLTLADESQSHSSWGYKALFGVLIAAGGYYAFKKKKGALGFGAKKETQNAKPQNLEVKILSKQSMGLRGEVALIEAGGMRVLVGVTSGSMTTLAVLPDEEHETDTIVTSDPVAPLRSGEAGRQREAHQEKRNSFFASSDLGPPIPARAAVTSFSANRYADMDDEPPPAKMESVRPSRAPKNDIGLNGRKTRASESPAALPDFAAALLDTPRKSEAPRALEGQARGLALALGKLK